MCISLDVWENLSKKSRLKINWDTDRVVQKFSIPSQADTLPCLIVGGSILQKNDFLLQIPFIMTSHFTIFLSKIVYVVNFPL